MPNEGELRLWTSNEKLTMALNAETEKRWWLWMPNWKCDMVTLNVVESGWMGAPNAKLQGNDEREMTPSVARHHNP